MIISREINKPISIENPVVTIGSFDGVHNAHVQIIKRINEIPHIFVEGGTTK